MAGIAEDITERKQFELQQLELVLERNKVRLLRDFINEASHDLKSPLSALNLKIYHLFRSEENQERRLLLEDLRHISARMGNLIDDLLTLARLDSINPAAKETVDLNKVVREVSYIIRPVSENKKIDLKLDLTDGVVLVHAEPDDLARAITNLMGNAVTYTPDGGAIVVRSQIDNQSAIITVQDTGIGIAKEDQGVVFNRFFRATNARETTSMGTGLGLTIVKKIVEQHQGQIDLSSELGVGTTFRIILPTMN